MDAQKLKFMISVQLELDKLATKLGADHPDVIATKALFESLSQSEIMIKEPKNNTSESYEKLVLVKSDTIAIRNHLEIRADVSIDFDFISNERVKKQLIKDNLRMENSRLDSQIKNDTERFHSFCVEAFYQIEELINYYFGIEYSFENFIVLLQQKNPGKIYNQKHVSDIAIAEKIFVFEGIFYYSQVDVLGKAIHYDSIITFIRELRNEELHRCSSIEKDTEQIVDKYKDLMKKIAVFNKTKPNQNIYYQKSANDKQIEKQGKFINFVRDKNYNLVRDTVSDLVLKIKNSLEK